MKRSLALLIAVVVCSVASASTITLKIPDATRPIPVAQEDFALVAAFANTGGTDPNLQGYDVAIRITPQGSVIGGLSIVGVAMDANRPANSIFAQNASFTIDSNSVPGTTLYRLSDFLNSGTGIIADGSALFKLYFRVAGGTVGSFGVDWFVDPNGHALNTAIYKDTDLNPVPGLVIEGGTITIPEPVSLLVLAGGGLLLLRRRRSR